MYEKVKPRVISPQERSNSLVKTRLDDGYVANKNLQPMREKQQETLAKEKETSGVERKKSITKIWGKISGVQSPLGSPRDGSAVSDQAAPEMELSR